MKRQLDRAKALRRLLAHHARMASSHGDLGAKTKEAMATMDQTVGPEWRVEIQLGGEAESAAPEEDYQTSAAEAGDATAKFYERVRQALASFGDGTEQAEFDSDEAQSAEELAVRQLMAKIAKYTGGSCG